MKPPRFTPEDVATAPTDFSVVAKENPRGVAVLDENVSIDLLFPNSWNLSQPFCNRESGIGLDSAEILGLVVFLEQEFKISVPDSQLTLELSSKASKRSPTIS